MRKGYHKITCNRGALHYGSKVTTCHVTQEGTKEAHSHHKYTNAQNFIV